MSDAEAFNTSRLCDVGVVLYDCEHKTPKPVEGSEFLYVAIPDLQGGRINLQTARRISETDFAEWTRKIKPRSGDVILTRRGRVGDSAVVPEGANMAIGQNLVVLRSEGDKVDQRYLRWALRGPLHDRQVSKFRNVGAVFDSLNCRDIPLFEIPLPSVGEQRRIADVLDALDVKIAHNGELISSIGDVLRSAFRASFLAVLETQADEVDGWSNGRLDDLVEVVMGQSPPGSSYSDDSSGVPLVQGMAAFGARFPNTEVFTARVTKLAAKGDVLMTVRAPVGEVNVCDREYCAGRGVAAIRSEYPAFTEQLMRALQPRWRSQEAGVIFPAVTRKDIAGLDVIVPPAELRREYEDWAKPMYAMMGELTEESRQLTVLRDTLLPLLLSGRMRVAEGLNEDGQLRRGVAA